MAVKVRWNNWFLGCTEDNIGNTNNNTFTILFIYFYIYIMLASKIVLIILIINKIYLVH